MGAEPVGAALVGLQVVEGVLDVFECVAVVVAVGLRVAGDHAAGVLELATGVLEPAARVVFGVLFVGVPLWAGLAVMALSSVSLSIQVK